MIQDDRNHSPDRPTSAAVDERRDAAPTVSSAAEADKNEDAHGEAAFRARAAVGLYRVEPPAHQGGSDFDLNPGLAAELAALAAATGAASPPLKRAAVLVPVVRRDPLTVLLTLRTDGLSSHAGQIAFPGGKVDAADADATAAALREAEEEIGLTSAFVEPLGYLDPYRTGTGFIIHPVVALVSPGFTIIPNPGEVSDVFEVPLGFLMDAANHQRHARVWNGRERHFYAMPYEQRFIWGATAGMLRNMHERLYRP